MSAVHAIDNSLIFLAAHHAASAMGIDFETEGKIERDTTLSIELEWLSKDSTISRVLVGVLFPEGIPSDLDFYARMERLRRALGLTKWSEHIVTLLWIAALKVLAVDDQQKLLMAFTATGHVFFEMHLGLGNVVREIRPESNFAAIWFPALVDRLGDDLNSSGVFGAIVSYCEYFPELAIKIPLAFGNSWKAETHTIIAAEIIGILRSLPLSNGNRNSLVTLEEQFRSSVRADHRHCFFQSWAITARRGGLDELKLTSLLVLFNTTSEEDRETAIVSVCRIVAADALEEVCLLRGLQWLDGQTSENLPPTSKHAIVTAVLRVAKRIWQLPGKSELNLVRLIENILPIQPKHLGTWEKLEEFLIKLIQYDRGEFDKLILTVAEKSADDIYKMMDSEKVFNRLIDILSFEGKDEFVTKLSFATGIGGRRLGLSIFERTGMTEFHNGFLELLERHDLRITLCIFQGLGMHGRVVGRFLLAVSSAFQKVSDVAQDEFLHEAILQCKNYPQNCLTAFKDAVHPADIILQAVEKADTYFADRDRVRASSLNNMAVPAFRRIAERKLRTLNREMHDLVQKKSIFSQLDIVRNVEAIYGNNFGFNNKTVTPPYSEMEGIPSHLFENPRLEFIDPEGMRLRRLKSLHMLDMLFKTNDP